MMLTIVLGVLIYSLVPWDNMTQRVLQRIILLPVVIAISFEFLKLTNSLREVPVLRYLGYPGLWLQLLTTKEPKDDQVEVSIASFKRVLELDAQMENAPAANQPVRTGVLDPLKG